jgi:predicted GIY-YIG superfamily endonuclease
MSKRKPQRASIQALQRDVELDRYVYVVRGKRGLLKIGLTNNVKRRMASLQNGSSQVLRLVKVLGPIRGAYHIEQALHEAFADKRQHGEWFAITKAELTSKLDRIIYKALCNMK